MKKQRKNRTTNCKEWQSPEKLTLLQGWRRDGLSHEQIAQNIGINRTTLYAWCKKSTDISDALKKGDEVVIYEVENAMYKSALGHYAEEVEITETESDKNGKVVTKNKRKKYIPPNVAAQIFILKNRRNMKWRENPDIVENDNVKDDGFIDAIKGTVAEDWSENDSSE